MLFARVHDVAPDGSATRVKDLVAPARIADLTRPVQITLPAFVHRFEPGHQVRVVLAVSVPGPDLRELASRGLPARMAGCP